MNKNLVLSTLALSIGAVFFLVPMQANADDTIKCGGMKWTDKGHDDNNPSSKKFYQMAYHASICDLAKCVDHSACADHEKVNIDKFKDSPAYVNANDEQQKELDESMEEGHGADGLVGYEILYAVEESS